MNDKGLKCTAAHHSFEEFASSKEKKTFIFISGVDLAWKTLKFPGVYAEIIRGLFRVKQRIPLLKQNTIW